MDIVIDAPKAIEIAEKFLENHHTTLNLKSSVLQETGDEKIWVIDFDVGFLEEQIKKVKVDANTGKILGYE